MVIHVSRVMGSTIFTIVLLHGLSYFPLHVISHPFLFSSCRIETMFNTFSKKIKVGCNFDTRITQWAMREAVEGKSDILRKFSIGV